MLYQGGGHQRASAYVGRRPWLAKGTSWLKTKRDAPRPIRTGRDRCSNAFANDWSTPFRVPDWEMSVLRAHPRGAPGQARPTSKRDWGHRPVGVSVIAGRPDNLVGSPAHVWNACCSTDRRLHLPRLRRNDSVFRSAVRCCSDARVAQRCTNCAGSSDDAEPDGSHASARRCTASRR